ncbi:MAG: inositol-3-phosphate synthase [Deltaproteobacteria bacterium]|nr:inositol-3-phosphate synthase [Deltaproteobacteria bacterium]
MGSSKKKAVVRPANGRLGVLTPGMGAVATTVYAGVEAIRRGLGAPIGSMTQMGELAIDGVEIPVSKAVPLAKIDDIVFGGWDIYAENAYESAKNAKVLDRDLLDEVKPALEKIVPMPAVFDPNYVKRISGPNVKTGKNKLDLANQLREDIRNFIKNNDLDRCVVVWCASTEVYTEIGPNHQSVKALEAAMERNDPSIPPSMIYAYAALKEGVPFANGSPNLTVDAPAIMELAVQQGVAICGKDFKTGQTLMKTVIAPMLRARLLGLSGWFSTNILGNRDGEVLDDPGSFKSKEVSKLSVLETILEPEKYPALYGDIHHNVKINYYPPRGDNKEGWDNIDITGWLGYPMQIKVNFLCRDSILAAPLVLDLALLMDLAQRTGRAGIQHWLSFYFKSPQTEIGGRPEHDLFQQLRNLQDELRAINEQARTGVLKVVHVNGHAAAAV